MVEQAIEQTIGAKARSTPAMYFYFRYILFIGIKFASFQIVVAAPAARSTLYAQHDRASNRANNM
jgi:hypothetical protein